MQNLARAIACAMAMSALTWTGCTTPSFSPPEPPDGGSTGATCGDDRFYLCGTRCCLNEMECVAGECRYPYSTARLWVYLCPSFNSTCDSQFFALDQTCSPIGASAQPGTCYDTGFEVNADSSYGLAACQECGGTCGNPGGFETPPGFYGPDWYSGFAFHCGESCSAPPDCGGRNPGTEPGQGGVSGGGNNPGGGSGGGGPIVVTVDAGQDDPEAGSGGIGAPGAGSGGAGGSMGLCAFSSAGTCVECTGVGDPACGAETCCSLEGAAYCTDLTVHACIQCTSDDDCDPGVPCCHRNRP